MLDLEGESKDGRRVLAAARAGFAEKRFMPSSKEAFHDYVRMLRGAVKELQKSFPEVVTMTVFGSQMKGYESKDSDVDVYLIVDRDREKKDISNRIGEMCDVCADLFRRQNIKNTDVHVSALSREKIHAIATSDYTPIFVELVPYFLPALDPSAIRNYRELIIQDFESLGDVAQDHWQKMCEALCRFENEGFPEELIIKRLVLYPRTLAQAREKYFSSERMKRVQKENQ